MLKTRTQVKVVHVQVTQVETAESELSELLSDGWKIEAMSGYGFGRGGGEHTRPIGTPYSGMQRQIGALIILTKSPFG